jgi:DNA-directed RNA polymerase specialized sigma24 family protein
MKALSTVSRRASIDTPRVPPPRRRWVLTQEAFDLLLASLGEDQESAGKRYLEIRRNLIRFFEWRGSPFPEDHADETINRIAKRILEGEEIRNPGSYYLGVARMLILEFNRERARQQQALSELTGSMISSDRPDESEERIDCLRHSLQKLSSDNRELILQYYDQKGSTIDSRKKLAEQLGISINTLRMRALRIRQYLQRCLESCQTDSNLTCSNGSLATLVSRRERRVSYGN